MKWLNKIRGLGSPNSTSLSSKNVAKERLKLALTYDRGGLSRGTIEQLRDEIIQLIAKHLAIREEDIQINFDRTTECDKLIATIPLQTTPWPQPRMANATAPKKTRSRRRRRRSRPAK